jgi:hypothetical protein
MVSIGSLAVFGIIALSQGPAQVRDAFAVTITEADEANPVSFRMLPVPDGQYTLKGKTHEIKGIWMGETEVLWDLYRIYYQRLDLSPAEQALGIDAKARPSKPYEPPDHGWGTTGFPAIHLHYLAAEALCAWLTKKVGKRFRLPTEAEWEIACSAGGLPVSAAEDTSWHAGNSAGQYQQAKTKKANRWGFYDMLGNAGEWVKPKTGAPLLKGGHFLTEISEMDSSSREVYSPLWQDSDPQLPKSKWWLSDASFAGMRLVCQE